MPKQINTNVIKLLGMLQDGQYQNGALMSEALGLSRNAVWKIVKKLTDYGIAIESAKGKGYRLQEPLILLQKNKIKSKLEEKKIKLFLFETLSSTNDYFKTAFKNTPAICLAEMQENGRGRLNREWQSPFGQNIYLSCLYPFTTDLSELAGLSLVTSLSMVKTLQHYGLGNALSVKWPNDVFYGTAKLGGNLIEVSAETNGVCHCVIGLGLNINMLEHSNISQSWTSLRNITGQYYDRNEVVASLINHLFRYIHRFIQHGFSHFIAEWLEVDGLLNKPIALQLANEKLQGTAKGINEQGHLLLALKAGETRAFSAGDANLVKK